MALHDELLKHAQFLATEDIANPQARRVLQVNLRRAISSAYYAVFHLLIAESVALLVPAKPATLRARVSRSFTHSDMNKICGTFARHNLPNELKAMLPNGVPDELRVVAETFCLLQQERHSADYDVGFKTIRSFALTRVKEAEKAFAAWKKIRGTEEAKVFLSALAFAARWSK